MVVTTSSALHSCEIPLYGHNHKKDPVSMPLTESLFPRETVMVALLIHMWFHMALIGANNQSFFIFHMGLRVAFSTAKIRTPTLTLTLTNPHPRPSTYIPNGYRTSTLNKPPSPLETDPHRHSDVTRQSLRLAKHCYESQTSKNFERRLMFRLALHQDSGRLEKNYS